MKTTIGDSMDFFISIIFNLLSCGISLQFCGFFAQDRSFYFVLL